MAKKVLSVIKLNIPAGKATPAPPIGPALGQAGINMMEFIKKFNEVTMDKMGSTLPVAITVYEDRSYDFVVKQPLASDLIKQAAGIEKGSGNQLTEKAGKLTKEQLRKIAEIKLPDLNTNDVEQAMKILAGTARNMGVEIVD
ncbi:MAG: 50S ribosomal protein L11 [Fimbriimonadales bacterium]|nr:MAG: 50S ribosomal protein L11 [Fimbriimonadales bacterium]